MTMDFNHKYPVLHNQAKQKYNGVAVYNIIMFILLVYFAGGFTKILMN